MPLDIRALLGMGSSATRVRARVVDASGVLFDEVGDLLQNQVVLHKGGIQLTNRVGVGLYKQRKEGIPPQRDGTLIVETGESHPYTQNPSLLANDLPDVHHSIRYGTRESGNSWLNKFDAMDWILMGMAAVMILITIVIMGAREIGSRDDPREETNAEATSGPGPEDGAPPGASGGTGEGEGGSGGDGGDGEQLPGRAPDGGVADSAGPLSDFAGPLPQVGGDPVESPPVGDTDTDGGGVP